MVNNVVVISRFLSTLSECFTGARNNMQNKKGLAPVVRKLDSAIHWINRYPEDKYYNNQLRYPVDSDLSTG